MLSSRDELTLASAELASSSPRSWQKFLGAVAKYAAVAKDDCVMSPLDRLQSNQGRAQALKMLSELFANAAADADRLNSK